jgi:hypothetical protein
MGNQPVDTKHLPFGDVRLLQADLRSVGLVTQDGAYHGSDRHHSRDAIEGGYPKVVQPCS